MQGRRNNKVGTSHFSFILNIINCDDFEDYDDDDYFTIIDDYADDCGLGVTIRWELHTFLLSWQNFFFNVGSC